MNHRIVLVPIQITLGRRPHAADRAQRHRQRSLEVDRGLGVDREAGQLGLEAGRDPGKK